MSKIIPLIKEDENYTGQQFRDKTIKQKDLAPDIQGQLYFNDIQQDRETQLKEFGQQDRQEVFLDSPFVVKLKEQSINVSNFQNGAMLSRIVRQQLQIDEDIQFSLSYQGKEIESDTALFKQQLVDQSNIEMHYSIMVNHNGVQKKVRVQYGQRIKGVKDEIRRAFEIQNDIQLFQNEQELKDQALIELSSTPLEFKLKQSSILNQTGSQIPKKTSINLSGLRSGQASGIKTRNLEQNQTSGIKVQDTKIQLSQQSKIKTQSQSSRIRLQKQEQITVTGTINKKTQLQEQNATSEIKEQNTQQNTQQHPVSAQQILSTDQSQSTNQPESINQPQRTHQPQHILQPQNIDQPEIIYQPQNSHQPQNTLQPECTHQPLNLYQPENTLQQESINLPLKNYLPKNTLQQESINQPTNTYQPENTFQQESIRHPLNTHQPENTLQQEPLNTHSTEHTLQRESIHQPLSAHPPGNTLQQESIHQPLLTQLLQNTLQQETLQQECIHETLNTHQPENTLQQENIHQPLNTHPTENNLQQESIHQPLYTHTPENTLQQESIHQPLNTQPPQNSLQQESMHQPLNTHPTENTLQQESIHQPLYTHTPENTLQQESIHQPLNTQPPQNSLQQESMHQPLNTHPTENTLQQESIHQPLNTHPPENTLQQESTHQPENTLQQPQNTPQPESTHQPQKTHQPQNTLQPESTHQPQITHPSQNVIFNQWDQLQIILVNQNNEKEILYVNVNLSSEVGTLDQRFFEGKAMNYLYKLEKMQKNLTFSEFNIQNGDRIIYSVIPSKPLTIYFQDFQSNQQQERVVESNQSIVKTFKSFLSQNSFQSNFSLQYLGEEVKNKYTTFEELQVQDYSQFYFNTSQQNESQDQKLEEQFAPRVIQDQKTNLELPRREYYVKKPKDPSKEKSREEGGSDLELPYRECYVKEDAQQNQFHQFLTEFFNDLTAAKTDINSALINLKNNIECLERKNGFFKCITNFFQNKNQTVGDFKDILSKILKLRAGSDIDVIVNGWKLSDSENLANFKTEKLETFSIKIVNKINLKFQNRKTKEVKETLLDFQAEILLGANNLEIANSKFFYNGEEIDVQKSCEELNFNQDNIIEYDPHEYHYI